MSGWSALDTAHDKIISAEMFGLSSLYYPGGATTAPSIQYGLVRSHEWNGGATSCFALTKWCNVETSKGVFNWDNVDQFVSTHKENGRKILLTIDGTPSWAVGSPRGNGVYKNSSGVIITSSNSCPDNINDFADWCRAVAQRYGTDCYYELWNEPDFKGSVGSYWVDSAKQLAAMMRCGYQAIKAVNQAIKVVSPSCTGSMATLYEMLTAGDGAGGYGVDHFDVLGFHLYSTPTGAVTNEPSWYAINSLKRILKELGRPTCEIWNTETGVIGGGLQAVTNADRKAYLRQFFALRIALAVYVNVFAYYDSSTMGLKLPESTGATYDMTGYWDEFVSSVVGKRLTRSVIDRDTLNNLFVTLYFSDGSSVSA